MFHFTPPKAQSDIRRFRWLAFSGGGLKGYAYVSALERLFEYDKKNSADPSSSFRDHLVGYSGASIGAFVALMLSLGMSCKDMHTAFSRFRISDLISPCMIRFASQRGLDSGKRLKEFLKELIAQAGLDPRATLSELRQKDNNRLLEVWVSDIDMAQPVGISALNSPNERIYRVVYASMAVPLILVPQKLWIGAERRLCIDGGILCNFPFDHGLAQGNKTLGLHVYSKNPYDCKGSCSASTSEHSKEKDIDSDSADEQLDKNSSLKLLSSNLGSTLDADPIAQYLVRIAFLPTDYIEKLNVRAADARWPGHIIQIPCPRLPLWRASLSSAQQQRLLQQGSNAALTWLRECMRQRKSMCSLGNVDEGMTSTSGRTPLYNLRPLFTYSELIGLIVAILATLIAMTLLGGLGVAHLAEKRCAQKCKSVCNNKTVKK